MEVLALDLDALAAGEADGLDDDLVVYSFQIRLGILCVVEAGVGEVPVDAVPLHELPHERFGRLYPGGGLRGGGTFDSRGLESIDDALAERGLGADESEFYVVRLGELHDLGDVLLVAQEMALGPGEDAGVGVLHDAVQLGAGPVERLHGGVLPSSASDGENPHVRHLRA